MASNMKWARSSQIAYPKTWLTFKQKDARDANDDKLVDYEICDLTQDRFEEAYEFLRTDYIKNEPINAHLAGGKFDSAGEACHRNICQSAVDAKTALVCYKTATKEIVGLSILSVFCEGNDSDEEVTGLTASEIGKIIFESFGVLYDGFDVFKHYHVDKYIGSYGLFVLEKYRGRGIGLKLVQTEKLMGQEFGIKMSHALFTSDYSDAIAEKVGYKIDKEISYKQLEEMDPKFAFNGIASKRMTARTWVY